jgi:hypothetical protein
MTRPWVCASFLLVVAAGCRASPGTIPANPHDVMDIKHARRAVAGSVVVHPAQVGAKVSGLVMGANMGVWYNVTLSDLAPAFTTAGMAATRWPGGRAADYYHWRTNTYGPGKCAGHPNAKSTFDNFMADIVRPAHLDVAVTVNYGSNAACNGGGDPSEAADWVAYANATNNYGITWWTVGNEQYGKWQIDLHSKPHDPTQYASNVATYYYPQMKAASTIPIDVCVDADPKISGWDAIVFARAQYDCVELHYYPQNNTVNDDFLIEGAAPKLTAYVQTVKGELAAAGRAGTPIYVGEIGSTAGTPGKQTQSITQALYAGQVLGELMQDGVARATWWLGFGSCDPPSKGGDFSQKLYGWQNFGGAMIFSDNAGKPNCPQDKARRGTLLATARAYQVASNFVRSGEHVLGVTVTSLPNVRAYATTYGGGYALMLFNLSKMAAVNAPVSVDGKSSGSGGTIVTYDKAIYDASKNNVWNGPTSATLPAWHASFTVNLPPWSIVVVQTK